MMEESCYVIWLIGIVDLIICLAIYIQSEMSVVERKKIK